MNKLLCRCMRLCVCCHCDRERNEKLVLAIFLPRVVGFDDAGASRFSLWGLRDTDASVMTNWQSRDLIPRLRWSISTYCCRIVDSGSYNKHAYRVRTQCFT
jgi:hypothetical protein